MSSGRSQFSVFVGAGLKWVDNTGFLPWRDELEDDDLDLFLLLCFLLDFLVFFFFGVLDGFLLECDADEDDDVGEELFLEDDEDDEDVGEGLFLRWRFLFSFWSFLDTDLPLFKLEVISPPPALITGWSTFPPSCQLGWDIDGPIFLGRGVSFSREASKAFSNELEFSS